MEKETRQKILDWIYENHCHHSTKKSAKLPVKVFKGNKWVALEDVEYVDESDCLDGNYPYVNSLDLEKFIKEL